MSSIVTCSKCSSKYDLGERHPMVCSYCKSSNCSVCKKCTIDYKESRCQNCAMTMYQTYVVEPYFASLADGLKLEFSITLEDQKKLTSELNDEVVRMNKKDMENCRTIDEKTRKLEEMGKKLEGLEKINESKVNDVKCAQCGLLEQENSMNICRTCTKIQSKIDVVDVKNSPGVDIKEFAICSTCSIRKHIRVGHNVIDFFPVLASNNHRIQSVVSKEFCSRMDQGMGKIKSLSTKWEGLVNDGKNGVLSMTDMLGQGKTSEVQKEMGKMIEEKSEKFIKTIEIAAENLEKIGNEFDDELKQTKDEVSTKFAEKCLTDADIRNTDDDLKNE